MHMRLRFLPFLLLLLAAWPAAARDFASTVTESDTLPRLRPEFQTPGEPNQLFYVQRSVNANTVVYAARLDARGDFDSREPVEGFWRWFNVDGHKKPLNFIERMMAYGVKADPPRKNAPRTFRIAALPERSLTLSFDAQKKPQALMRIGDRTVKVAYVYLQVVEGGLTPDVPSLDILGTDTATGRAVHEHLIVK
jgi:hypothetical protein